jgi:Asp-tRNA(Asn)/Glu-tRNA(Gln) amidotransferase A subunit family amidase
MTNSIQWLDLSPEQALLRSISHIQQKDHRIKAFVSLESPERLQHRLHTAQYKPLRGLPIGLKDIIETADLPTQFGTPIFEGFKPRQDAAIVHRLKQLGALVVGKTATTELAYLEPAATLNPHEPLADLTPGGSSSGSAAAVAADMVPFSVGTQTGGSVIRPASYCGVVGFKPSAPLLPMAGINEFSHTLDCLGFFAPNVNTMAWVCGHLHDSFQLSAKPLGLLRLGFIEEAPWPAAQPEANSALRHFKQLAIAANFICSVALLPGSSATAFDAHAVVQDYEAKHALGWVYTNHSERLSAPLRSLLAHAQSITYEQYARAQNQIAEAKRDIDKIFDRVDLLVLPSAPGAPPARSSTGVSTFNRLFTALGLPCMSIPYWIEHQGRQVPIGIQLVGRAGQDAKLLQYAQGLEDLIPNL